MIRTLRAVIDLTIDAVEAFAFAVFDFDRVADELWAATSSGSRP